MLLITRTKPNLIFTLDSVAGIYWRRKRHGNYHSLKPICLPNSSTWSLNYYHSNYYSTVKQNPYKQVFLSKTSLERLSFVWRWGINFWSPKFSVILGYADFIIMFRKEIKNLNFIFLNLLFNKEKIFIILNG